MAKKKKQTRKRKPTPAEEQRSVFWPLAGAILMVLLAIFLLLGGFGTGGPLPKGLFHAAYWLLGWGAYLTPIALTYFGILKFNSEDRQIPLGNLISMLAGLFLSAGWLHVTFGVKDSLGDVTNGHGGEAGKLVGGVVLGAIDKIPASLMFFIFAMLAFFFAFAISPKVLLKILDLFKRPEREADSDLSALKARASEHAFKLNEGVPVEHHGSSALSNFRNTSQKSTPVKEHSALTTASDPDWKLPSTSLLNHKQDKADPGDVEGNARTIHQSFDQFGYAVKMEGANVGPRITQYTLKPPAGIKLTKITALEDNIKLDLAANSIRMEAPIPGTKLVGIEVPNVKSATVRISGLLESDDWLKQKSLLTFTVGKDIAGEPVLADLAEMPHLLVAGQTKAGKSVMINAILTSFLYRNSPADLKLILVDPKLVELKPFDDIPHLLTPVITEPEKCISALKWTVAEMERRYKELSKARVRNIVEYNDQKKEAGMPYIVLVIDELADLMMMAPRDMESLIVRIAQKARAVGIHLILATQSPRVTVITGLIKANIPARIAFTVSQDVESRIILDQSGAQKLLGKGDMLFSTSDMPKPKRLQGALIETPEINAVTEFIRNQRDHDYNDEVVSLPVQLDGRGGVVADVDDEPLFKQAVEAVIQARKASTSLLQRRLRIGYGKAARLMESMEEQGIIGAADGSRPREVLVNSVDEVFSAGESVDAIPDDVPEEIE